MIGLLNPWVILGLLMALAGLYRFGHHEGYQEAQDEAKIEIARLNEVSRGKEQVLNQKITDQAYDLKRTQDELSKKKSAMYRLADTGKLRLPSASCVQPAQDAASPAGDRSQAPSELERQALRVLIDIAAEGDAAITQLNSCIDAYNSVREQINGH